MKLAFIGHLRVLQDLVCSQVLPISESALPFVQQNTTEILDWFLTQKNEPEILRRFRWSPPKKEGGGFFVRQEFVADGIEGFFIMIWLTGEQMIDPTRIHLVRNRILDAVLYSKNELKCDIVGLGGLTSSVTDSGEWVVRQLQNRRIKVAVTHGDTYTAAVAVQGIEKSVALTGLDLYGNARLDIVGATGLIGTALSKKFAPMGKRLLLTGRNLIKLQRLKFELGPVADVKISQDIAEARTSDVVVTATSWPGALLRKEHLKKGAVIYDISQPRNTTATLSRERPDILIIDGALVQIPPPLELWSFGLPQKRTVACLAETIMQAMEGDLQNHVGPIELEHMERTCRWADTHGFPLADLTSFGEPLPSLRRA